MDFTTRLTAKWRLKTLPTTPIQPAKSEHGVAELEDILRQLVGIPTVTGNYEANHNALDYIEKFLKGRGLYTKRLEWNGIESLWAATKNTRTPKVILSAHLDVVPGNEELFELRSDDTKYYGRGVLDMKYAIAAYMQLAHEFQHKLNQYDFGIMITTDEEAGGLDGVAKFVEDGYVPEVCILPDGGMGWQVQLFSKGFLYLSITSRGVSAHGSRPWLGENAIEKLLGTIQEIRELFPDPGNDPDTTHNTLNIGKIYGGKAVNQVADSAEVLFDIRYATHEDREMILQQIEKVCTKHGTSMKVIIAGDPTKFSLEDPYINSFARITTKVTGIPVEGSRTPASSDIRYYTKYNVPCISIYPPGGGHHGANEWLSKEGLYQFKEILQNYLEETSHRS